MSETRTSPNTKDAPVQTPWIRDVSTTGLYAEANKVVTEYLTTSQRTTVPPGGATAGVDIAVRDYHEAFRAGADCGYLRDHYIGELFPDLQRAVYRLLGIDNWLLHPTSPVHPSWFWLFVGGDGTGSPLHMDVITSSAWNLVFEGEKHWELQPPALAVDRGALPESFLQQPGVDTSRDTVTFVQRAGDLVYIPSGWAHSVRNAGQTVAITGNYVDAANYPLIHHCLTAAGEQSLLGQLDALAGHFSHSG